MITWFHVGYIIASKNLEVLIRCIGLEEEEVGDVLSGYHFGYLELCPEIDY